MNPTHYYWSSPLLTITTQFINPIYILFDTPHYPFPISIPSHFPQPITISSHPLLLISATPNHDHAIYWPHIPIIQHLAWPTYHTHPFPFLPSIKIHNDSDFPVSSRTRKHFPSLLGSIGWQERQPGSEPSVPRSGRLVFDGGHKIHHSTKARKAWRWNMTVGEFVYPDLVVPFFGLVFLVLLRLYCLLIYACCNLNA